MNPMLFNLSFTNTRFVSFVIYCIIIRLEGAKKLAALSDGSRFASESKL